MVSARDRVGPVQQKAWAAATQSLRSADMSSSGPAHWLDLGPGWLFEQIRDAVAVIELPRGTIRLWNPSAERLFGYSREEILGRAIDEVVPGLLAGHEPSRAGELTARTAIGER